MAWKKLGDDVTKWNEKGQAVEGVYRGFTEHTFSDRQVKLYELNGDGKSVKFWSTTVLDRRMDQVPEGARVRVTYRGESGPPQRRYKDFDVEVAEEAQP